MEGRFIKICCERTNAFSALEYEIIDFSTNT